MGTHAVAHCPASTAEAKRSCSRYRQCPLAQRILCCAGAVFSVCRSRAVWSILSEVNHQLESRMRETRLSGSEGGGTTRSPYPYIRRQSRGQNRRAGDYLPLKSATCYPLKQFA